MLFAYTTSGWAAGCFITTDFFRLRMLLFVSHCNNCLINLLFVVMTLIAVLYSFVIALFTI